MNPQATFDALVRERRWTFVDRPVGSLHLPRLVSDTDAELIEVQS